MTVGFLCKGDPTDKRTWSGTTFKMYTAIKNLGYDVHWIPPTEYNKSQSLFLEKKAKLHEKIFNRTYNRFQNISKAFWASNDTEKRLKNIKIDILFVVGCINEIAFLKTDIPIVYINDILYIQHLHYYPAYMGLGWYSKKTLTFLEKKALQKCDAIILPSEWSVNRAIETYKIAKEKVHLLRFGANIDVPDVEDFTPKKLSSQLKFLFLGVEWERKGGNIAQETIEILNKKGISSTLQIVGCTPPQQTDFMEVIPFLNKNIPQDYEQLKVILREADFLFVPTRAECYGIVFCEASAYGLPSITTDTGGVTSIVKNGINGIALPIEASADEYVNSIESLIKSSESYKELSISSRKRYDTSLNWDKWQADLAEIFNQFSK